jgi:hypothetical protein
VYNFQNCKSWIYPRRGISIWFQASAAMLMKSAVFWGITRRREVIIYRRFGTTYRSHPHGSRVRIGKKAYNVDSGKYGGVAKRVMWWQPIGWERGEAHLCKLEKRTFLTGSVLDVKQIGRPQKHLYVSVCVQKSILQSPRKSKKEWSAELQIPKTSNFFKEMLI